MNEFLSNPWTKRAASLVSVLFCVGICGLSYLSVFYEVRMVHPVSFCIVWSLLSLLFLTVMLYSRRQVLTRLSSFAAACAFSSRSALLWKLGIDSAVGADLARHLLPIRVRRNH